jgi:hypothetical protein
MKAKLKSLLAKEYRVSYTTFVKWLNEVPNLNLKPNQRLLTPIQIKMIYEYHGHPEGE